LRLRELTPADRPRLLALNLASVRELSELDDQRLHWILSLAHRSLVVESEGEMVAFALAIAPGTVYDSENYRWFGDRFERMVCEVNVLPPNPASLAFHRSRGYVEVGRLTHGQGKVVALLSKELDPEGHRIGVVKSAA
jgi:predicted GNAT superfamily acetyltransferase